MVRNDIKDKVAIVGVGSTEYGRDLQRTPLSLGLEAATKAIEDAGVNKMQIDGICGSATDVLGKVGDATYLAVQGALGIAETTWAMNGWLGSCLVHAAQAVHSGLCDYALVVQAYNRDTAMSRSAANDPFRVRAAQHTTLPIGQSQGRTDDAQRWYHSGEPYAAWMRRYMNDYGATKETFGRIAVNNRTQASKNPAAALQAAITMDDYLNSRPVWDPFVLLDMDLPVDCGEALVLTTAERATDSPYEPIYIHAASLGGTGVGEYYENGISWTKTAPWTAMKGLWHRSDVTVDEIDLFYPYDGYTTLAVAYTEAAGFCGPGEAKDLFESSWDEDEQLLKFGGRTRLSTNGGSLSHGRAGGFNYYSEAVRQLRGQAGARQVEGAETALFGIGSFYHDPVAAVFRTD